MQPSTPAPRRRVRTGCLTCRARRRKCDEGRPSCLNCTSKSLTCRYGSRITFATPWIGDQHGYASVASPRRLTRNADSAVDEDHDVQYGSNPGPAAAASTIATPRVQHEVPLFASRSSTQGDGHVDGTAQRTSSRTSARLLDRRRDEDSGLHSCLGCVGVPAGSGEPLTEHLELQDSISQTPPSHETAWPAEGTPISWLPATYASSGESFALQSIATMNIYRDRIATIMDLGMSDAFWGVEALHNSLQCPNVNEAILTVADQYIRRPDSGLSLRSLVMHTPPAVETPFSQHLWTISLLRATAMVLSTRPTIWLDGLRELGLDAWPVGLPEEHQHLGDRIVLAATLSAKSDALTRGFPLLHSAPAVFNPDGPASSIDQVRQALRILGRSLYLLPEHLHRLRHSAPISSVWLSCWSEAQLWYATRCEEFRPVLEFAESEGASPDRVISPDFPCLMFSNIAALVANCAHHLTSLVLLRYKPRRIQVTSEAGSSASPPWHALRILGVAANTVELGLWDPLIAVAVVKAGEKLSHVAQIKAAVGILQSLCSLSGMRFDEDILALENLAKMDFSNAF